MARPVLDPGPMNRVALAAVLVAASTSAASAGTYLGLGLGSEAKLDGQMTQFTGDGRSFRGLLGYKLGRLAVEGSLSGYDVWNPVNQSPYPVRTLAAALKYSLPLGDNFEVFGRAGLQRTSLSYDPDNVSWDGNGYLLGAGFEYRIDAVLTGVSIWVDFNRTSAKLTAPHGESFDGGASTWTLGASLAI